MGSYYLDIETTGLKHADDKIITIQWQELERCTGRSIGDLNFLKEWESSEKDIIAEFIGRAHLEDPYDFAFVPIGYNLSFEHGFLSYKSKLHKLFPIDIVSRPHIDLHQLSILMHRGEFAGTKLSDMTGKPSDGRVIPSWYRDKDFDKIEEYVTREASEFVKFVEWSYRHVPTLAGSLHDHFH